MLPVDEVIQLYSHAAVFCCPSVYEPFGIINLEAMACEAPVVASAVGGILEVVEDGVTGLLVPPSRPRELAVALNVVLGDRERARAMGKAEGASRAAPAGPACPRTETSTRITETFRRDARSAAWPAPGIACPPAPSISMVVSERLCPRAGSARGAASRAPAGAPRVPLNNSRATGEDLRRRLHGHGITAGTWSRHWRSSASSSPSDSGARGAVMGAGATEVVRRRSCARRLRDARQASVVVVGNDFDVSYARTPRRRGRWRRGPGHARPDPRLPVEGRLLPGCAAFVGRWPWRRVFDRSSWVPDPPLFHVTMADGVPRPAAMVSDTLPLT
jgi:hypothetical protein